jgi:hypothetical protein
MTSQLMSGESKTHIGICRFGCEATSSDLVGTRFAGTRLVPEIQAIGIHHFHKGMI